MIKIKDIIKLNLKLNNLKKLFSQFNLFNPRLTDLILENNPSMNNWKDKYNSIKIKNILSILLILKNSNATKDKDKVIKDGIKNDQFGDDNKINFKVFSPSLIVFKWLLAFIRPSLKKVIGIAMIKKKILGQNYTYRAKN